jgi:two-component system, OmpR family, phosphate regulon response regulator PhoB
MQLNPPTDFHSPGISRSNGHQHDGPAVLIVDDEPAFCFAMAEILRINGYVVMQANSVLEALSMLEEALPDLILTDIMMPGSDGLAFIRQLRGRDDWAKIPTIAVSAKAMSQDREAAREAGADGYLAKPFSAQELQETIRLHAQSRAA